MRLGVDPKKPCPPPTKKKFPSLPTLEAAFNIASVVYSVLVETLSGSWWIAKLKMRLGGNPKSHRCQWALHFCLPSQRCSGPQHSQQWFMTFWSNLKYIVGGLSKFDTRMGWEPTCHGWWQPYILAFLPNIGNGP